MIAIAVVKQDSCSTVSPHVHEVDSVCENQPIGSLKPVPKPQSTHATREFLSRKKKMACASQCWDDDKLDLLFDCTRPFFPSKDALRTDVLGNDQARLARVVHIMNTKVQARRFPSPPFEASFPAGSSRRGSTLN